MKRAAVCGIPFQGSYYFDAGSFPFFISLTVKNSVVGFESSLSGSLQVDKIHVWLYFMAKNKIKLEFYFLSIAFPNFGKLYLNFLVMSVDFLICFKVCVFWSKSNILDIWFG